MLYELQGTIDICFKVKSFSNLSDIYLKALFFTISASAGNNIAAPYQIISAKESQSSITLLEYLSPQVTFGPSATADLSELVVFRINVPIQDFQQSTLTYKFTLVHVHPNQVQRVVDEIEITHTTLLWIDSYCPVFFVNQGCSIDVSVQTQLLKFRTKNISLTPKSYLMTALESTLISFNKLKGRLLSKKTELKMIQSQQQLVNEFQELRKPSSHKIFQDQNQDKNQLRDKLISLSYKFLPQLSDLLQQGWSVYLKGEKLFTLYQQKTNFLNTLSFSIKQLIQQNPEKLVKKRDMVLDTIKMQTIPLALKLYHKQQGQPKLKNNYPHFVFLVHGYGASSIVTTQFKLTLLYYFPHLIVINSNCNQNKTEDDIQTMGKRLATEVELTINSKQFGNNYHISFITHSLGGLIVRSALTFIAHQQFHMKAFITLATPHLGHLFHNSVLNKLGMWAFVKLNDSKVMSALLLQAPQKNYRKSFIYQLSTLSGLNWFEQVVFYGCRSDKFVSLESSLCLNTEEIVRGKQQNNNKACVWQQMRLNIQDKLRDVSFSKYQVDFSEQNEKEQFSFTDDWLGRRDHMNLCLSQNFVNCVLALNKHLFI